MTENPGRIRSLLDDTLTDEPPLLDLVPAAVARAEHGQRRMRLMAGCTAVAVLAVTAGVYGMADHGGGSTSPGHSTSAGSPTITPSPDHSNPHKPQMSSKTHTSTYGLPGLFDHPGTPEEQCAKSKMSPKFSSQLVSEARDYCVRALNQLRALMPDAVVVPQPMIDFNQPGWSESLAKTPDGSTPPGFVQAYQKAAQNPAKVDYMANDFAFRTAQGTEGTIFYATTLPGVKAKPEPGGDLPLGDGTSGHFKQDDNGNIDVSGVTANGLWYDLAVSGVHPVYSESGGGWLSPTFKGDGMARALFPDGYVLATEPNQTFRIPNPYSPTQVRDMIAARGLGTLVNTISADPLSEFPGPN
jgi:hypothetical protein